MLGGSLSFDTRRDGDFGAGPGVEGERSRFLDPFRVTGDDLAGGVCILKRCTLKDILQKILCYKRSFVF